MKKLDLNKYGIQEMNAKELLKTDGGSLVTTIIEILQKGIIIWI
jgi:hypothetical protein